MNIFLLLFTLFSCQITFAQTALHTLISLKPGEKIIAVSTITAEADLGMGMQMKNNSQTTSTVLATSETDKELILSTTVTRLKTSMEMMGQNHDYDSDKEGDRNSEVGKSLSVVVGKAQVLKLNKFTGSPVITTYDSSVNTVERNKMKDLISVMGGEAEEVSASGAFMLLPPEKRTGDIWNKADSSKGSKVSTSYTVKSIKDNIATVSYSTLRNTNNVVALEGNDMNVVMETKIKGEVLVDTKTNRVLTRIMDSESTGVLDIAGQSMPVTAKTHLETVYTLTKN